MKYTIIYIILSLMLFTSAASAAVVEPITEFTNITPTEIITVPDQMHTFEYTVTSTHAIDIAINFTISHTEIECDEWDVEIYLNSNKIGTNESQPGYFISNETILPAGKSNLNVTVQSIPYIVPGNYSFEIRILHDNVIIIPRKSSGGGRRYPTPTPTPTPVNATPVSIPVLVNESNETSMHIDVPEPSQEPDSNWIIYGTLGIIAAALLAYAYSKRNKSG